MSIITTIQTQTLPQDLVIHICEYIGKFIVLANGKLKSIIDMRDFVHLAPLILNRQFYRYHTLQRMWDRKEEKYKEQRHKDHVLHCQNIVFERHPLLFMEEHSIEEMTPLQDNLFCDTCEKSMPSTVLYKDTQRFRKYGIFGYKMINHTMSYYTTEFFEMFKWRCYTNYNNKQSVLICIHCTQFNQMKKTEEATKKRDIFPIKTYVKPNTMKRQRMSNRSYHQFRR